MSEYVALYSPYATFIILHRNLILVCLKYARHMPHHVIYTGMLCENNRLQNNESPDVFNNTVAVTSTITALFQALTPYYWLSCRLIVFTL